MSISGEPLPLISSRVSERISKVAESIQVSTDSHMNYFEKKLKARKKRAYHVLRQFNPSLAEHVIFKKGVKKVSHPRVQAAITI